MSSFLTWWAGQPTLEVGRAYSCRGWRERFSDFPPPLTVISMGPIWRWDDVMSAGPAWSPYIASEEINCAYRSPPEHGCSDRKGDPYHTWWAIDFDVANDDPPNTLPIAERIQVRATGPGEVIARVDKHPGHKPSEPVSCPEDEGLTTTAAMDTGTLLRSSMTRAGFRCMAICSRFGFRSDRG